MVAEHVFKCVPGPIWAAVTAWHSAAGMLWLQRIGVGWVRGVTETWMLGGAVGLSI